MLRKSFLFLALVSVPVGLTVVPGCGESSSSSSSSSTSGSSSSSGSSGSSGFNPPPVSTVDGGADPVTGEVRFLSLGDSLSQGVGATPDMETGSWPAQLAAKWRARGCKVELNNPAVSGYTAENIITDQLPNIAAFKPTFITFQVGANDIATGVTIDKYRENVKTILAAATGSGARVVVMPENEWFRSPQGQTYGPGLAEKRDAFDQVLIDETKAKGAEFVDLRLLFKQHADANMWGPDGIHPTPAAYEQWAVELARVIPSPCGK